ncbi:MAG: DUF2207 domain-containing protein, partial [Eggerthellaceae bacterium]|nr:DUF2207 domain-containing protein [Eggerthellaceae bacterium]
TSLQQKQFRKQFTLLTTAGALFASLLLSLCAATIAIAGSPLPAYAKSYSMPKVDIVANVGTDGSLNVLEHRTFDFDGSFTAVWWTFSGFPANASLKINGVSLTTASGQTTKLSEEAFVVSWREAGGPGKDAYSVDKVRDTVYVFFRVSNQKLVVSLDYTVVNGAQVYSDVAEVYWKFVADQWQEASQNVTMSLSLPVPEGVVVVPGENVRAWGHGPLSGEVSFKPDGTMLYVVDYVSAGQYAEARVTFDHGWLTNLDASALTNQDENRLDTILREERNWSLRSNLERVAGIALQILFALAPLAAFLWALRLYLKYGKEHKPEFTETYWRDLPSNKDHPAAIARLWRFNKESTSDFTATLIHLVNSGAILINKGSYYKPGSFGKSQLVEDYYLTRVPEVANLVKSPIDREALHFLFNEISKGANSLWFGSISKYGKDYASSFLNTLDAWQGLLTKEVNARGFFEAKSKKMQEAVVGIVTVLIVIACVAGAITESFLHIGIATPFIIAMIVLAKKMPRRSPEGNNIYAKCKALAKWLKDFTLLNERPPSDVRVWGEFMVYATTFGIAKQVIEALRLRLPELFNQNISSGSSVPWWVWYASSTGSSGAAIAPIAETLQSVVSNTTRAARSATSSAGSSFSSGSGGGGGFSGGGGGGFGGGGGAR